MVITELVANAVDHARSESTLSVGVKRGDPVRRRARRPARPDAPAGPDRPDGAPRPWPADGRRADQRVGRDAARRRQDRLGGRELNRVAAASARQRVRLGRSGQFVAGELLPQRALGELPDAGLRHLVDELHGVGQPPASRTSGSRCSRTSVGRQRLARLDHHAGQRPLHPLLVGTPITAASATFGCAMISFSSSTELIHSPPDLTRSFVRSTSRTLAVAVDGRDVAGAQPAVVGELRAAALAAVVLRRRSTGRRPASRRWRLSSHGWTSPVPGSTSRSSTSGTGCPCRARASARCVLVERRRTAARARDRGDRDGLGHAPGVQDRQADRRPVRLRQRPRHGRAAAEDPPQRRQVVARRSNGSAPIQIVGTPPVTVTRWRSSSPRIALRGHVRAGEHHARPGQQRSVRAAPTRWRGTSAPPAARRRAPTAPGPSAVSEISECSSVERWL